jgi:hypothetical protein
MMSVPAFFAIAVAWSWTAWGLAIATGQPTSEPAVLALHLIGGIGPAVAATFVAGCSVWRRALDIGSLTIPTLAAVVALAALPALAGGLATGGHVAIGTGTAAAAGFALAAGLAEEPGWRGVALERLGRTSVAAALGVGAVWALWHVPLFFIDGTYQASLGFGSPGSAWFLASLLDLATLLLAAPILAAGLWTSGRDSPIGRLAVVGGLLYLIYNYAIYGASIAMNVLAAVYIAVLGLAVWSFALILTSEEVSTAAGAVLGRLPRRTTAWFLVVVAVLFGLLWLSQIAAFTFTGQLPADLERADLPANPVYALDLAVFLPLAMVAGIGLLRGRRGAAAFALPMLIWVFLTSAGIVGGFLFAALAGDVVPIAVAVVVGGVGVLAAVLAAIPLAGISLAIGRG